MIGFVIVRNQIQIIVCSHQSEWHAWFGRGVVAILAILIKGVFLQVDGVKPEWSGVIVLQPPFCFVECNGVWQQRVGAVGVR